MLFKVEKIIESVTVMDDPNSVVDGALHAITSTMKLREVTEKVDHGKTVHWVSRGDWSMHQLLYKLLEKTGPADVYISSYAFSEKPARALADMKHNGIIQKLFCVIDSRIDVRSASALAMIKNMADYHKLTTTHAKVTLIKNKNWLLTVVGSANYTTNKRYETGFICSDAEVFNLHQTWILDELRNDV